MAPLSFHFVSGSGPLWRIDPGIKLLAAAGLSIASFYAEAAGMGLLTALLAACIVLVRVRFTTLVKELRIFAFIGAVVFIGVAAGTPGRPVGSLRFVTVEGLAAGGLVAWRLGFLVMIGSVLTASTRVADLRRGIRRILAPIPLIPETRIAFLLSMTVAVLPLISDSAAEVKDAQRSRCSDLHRNPIRKVRNLTLPLLMKVFRKADEIGDAMEARAFDPDSSAGVPALPPFAARDYVAAAVTLAACIAASLIGR